MATNRLMKQIAVGCVFGILSWSWVPQANARDARKGAYEPVTITKTQQEQLLKLMQSADEKVKAGFVGQDKLEDEMRAQLKAISSIKSAAERRKAIDSYQAKYRKSYEEVLRKGNLDLNAVLAQLRIIIPDYTFRIENLAIVGTRDETASTTPGPATPSVTTRQIEPSDFYTDQEIGCLGLGLSSVIQTDESITVSATAAAAGLCLNEGYKGATVDLPAERKSARVRAVANLFTEGFAVAAATAAMSSAAASFGVECGDARRHASRSVNAIAALLWATYVNEELPDASNEVAAPTSVDECYVYADSVAFTLGNGISASYASSTLDHFAASVTIEQ